MEGPTDAIVLRRRTRTRTTTRDPPETTPTRWRRRGRSGCGGWRAPAVLQGALWFASTVPVWMLIFHAAPRHLFFSHHPSLTLVLELQYLPNTRKLGGQVKYDLTTHKLSRECEK